MFEFLRQFRPGNRSLKTVLGLYFIPATVIPVIVVSLYAHREFQKNIQNILKNQAKSERDAIKAEMEASDTRLLDGARLHATRTRLINGVQFRDKAAIKRAFGKFQKEFTVRVYSRKGEYIVGNDVRKKSSVPYISRSSMRNLRRRGETVGRYFSQDGNGLVTVIRVYIKSKLKGIAGILEEEHYFGNKELMALRQKRQVDAVILKRDFSVAAGSFALSSDILKYISSSVFRAGSDPTSPINIRLGDSRYAAFLYDLSSRQKQNWGYLAVFLSVAALDESAAELRLYLVYLTAILVLIALFIILVLSRQIVRPIEALVIGMKRIKTGRLEQIPEIDSTYEIEYLVRSFNDMARNIHDAKHVLESKLKELHHANSEIKNAQSTLVQSAKMASLGQLVAGVAHELNNPIGFIYSNMQHLFEYVSKLRDFYAQYKEVEPKLPVEKRKAMQKVIADLDVEYILRDIEELTQSCVDGAQRTKEIVLGLRTFSRTEDSKFSPADINQGLQSTIKLLTTKYKDRIVIHEEYGELPLVECNLSQLNQVFMNLISNAAQAIPNDGDIWVRTRAKKKEVIIEIEDNGAGMPEEVADKIFDPFFTTKKVGDGTGLGLSIAYGLIQKHQGTIQVDTEIGKGTRFEIALPVIQPVSLAG